MYQSRKGGHSEREGGSVEERVLAWPLGVVVSCNRKGDDGHMVEGL